VGVSGFTLGGGFGYTAMDHGMASDNVVGATVVVVGKDKKVTTIKVSKDQNEDMYWGIRGGTGCNFGIVVEWKFKVYAMAKVAQIQIDWKMEDGPTVLKYWQDNYTKTLQKKDRKLGLLWFLAHVQKDGKTIPMCSVRGFWNGEKEFADKWIEEFVSKCGAVPLTTYAVKMTSYKEANTNLLDNIEGVIPSTSLETKRCAYAIKPLEIDNFRSIVNNMMKAPSIWNIASFEGYGGAILDTKPGDTAFVHRDVYFNMFVDSFWLNPQMKQEAEDWLNNLYDHSGLSDHYYQNYPYPEYKKPLEGYFGDNLERMKQVKKQYDPTNFFYFPQSIPLGSTTAVPNTAGMGSLDPSITKCV